MQVWRGYRDVSFREVMAMHHGFSCRWKRYIMLFFYMFLFESSLSGNVIHSSQFGYFEWSTKPANCPDPETVSVKVSSA